MRTGTTCWNALPEQSRWPENRPAAPAGHAHKPHGWLSEGTRAMLRRYACGAGLVVELGTWMGRSALFMLGLSPTLRLICVDTWLGSTQIVSRHADMLPWIFSACQYHLWPHRNRASLLKYDTITGLNILAGRGFRPDLVYVDASHDAHSVWADTLASGTLYPDADIVGDDWDGFGVAEGVREANKELSRKLDHNDKAWHLSMRAE